MSTPRKSRWKGSSPTVLLVHGAFVDASSWSGVIPILQAAGCDVLAAANPLRGLAADAAYIASVANEINGPVLLVGHGYGGAVITAAASATANVIGLVYVAAFALDAGESALDVTKRFVKSNVLECLRPTTFSRGDGVPMVELSIRPEAFQATYAHDLPTRVAAVMAVSQRPLAADAFVEQSACAARENVPTWYVVASADRAITPAAQRFMAQRAHAATVEIGASHAITLTQPIAVAGVIRAATQWLP